VDSAGFAALWPDHTLTDAQRAQAAVDGGAGSRRWQTDARAVATRFATDVLGWPTPHLVQFAAGGSSGEQASARMCAASCPSLGADFDAEISLRQFVTQGAGGVWDVEGVEDDKLHAGGSIGLDEPGQRLASGRELELFASPPRFGGLRNGSRVDAGSVLWGKCGPVVDAVAVPLWFHETRIQLAGQRDSSCGSPLLTRPGLVAPLDGFVLAASPSTTDVWALVRALTGGPAPAEPIEDLLAIPEHFVPRRPGAAFPEPPPAWWRADPSSLPACRADQVRLGAAGSDFVNGWQALVGVDVRITSPPACRVEVMVDLRARGHHGGPIGVRVAAANVSGVLPRQTLTARWLWSGWCAEGRPRFDFILRGSTSAPVSLRPSEAPQCRARGAGPTAITPLD